MSDIKVSHLIPEEANTIIFAHKGSLDSGRRLEISSIPIPTAYARVKFLQSEKSKPRPSQTSQPAIDIVLDVAPETTEPSAVNIPTGPRANRQHRRNEQARENHHCASITNVIHNSYPGNTSITQEAETNPTSLPRIISQNQGQTQGRNKAQAEGSLQCHAMSNVINNNNGHGASHGSPSQNALNTSSQDTPPSQRESKRKRGENSSSQPASRPINPTVQTSNLIKEKDRIVNVGQCRRCNAHGPFRMEIRNCCRLIACTYCGPYIYQYYHSRTCVHRRQEIEENKRKAGASMQDNEDSKSENTLVSLEEDDDDSDVEETFAPVSAATVHPSRSRNFKHQRRQ